MVFRSRLSPSYQLLRLFGWRRRMPEEYSQWVGLQKRVLRILTLAMVLQCEVDRPSDYVSSYGKLWKSRPHVLTGCWRLSQGFFEPVLLTVHSPAAVKANLVGFLIVSAASDRLEHFVLDALDLETLGRELVVGVHADEVAFDTAARGPSTSLCDPSPVGRVATSAVRRSSAMR
jgi:hypothetical protein